MRKEMLSQLQEKYSDRFVVSKKSDFIIEGFPRSSNTFTVDFINLQLRKINLDWKIAHHTHDARNLLVAADFKLPGIILIRDPVEAISSYIIYYDFKKTVEQGVYMYINFYNTALDCINKFVTANFCDVIKNFNQIIDKVNKKYSLSIPFSHDLDRDTQLIKQIQENRAKQKLINEKDYNNKVPFPNENRIILLEDTKLQVNEYLRFNRRALDLFEKIICIENVGS